MPVYPECRMRILLGVKKQFISWVLGCSSRPHLRGPRVSGQCRIRRCGCLGKMMGECCLLCFLSKYSETSIFYFSSFHLHAWLNTYRSKSTIKLSAQRGTDVITTPVQEQPSGEGCSPRKWLEKDGKQYSASWVSGTSWGDPSRTFLVSRLRQDQVRTNTL